MAPQVNKQPISELVPRMVCRRFITKDDELQREQLFSEFFFPIIVSELYITMI